MLPLLNNYQKCKYCSSSFLNKQGLKRHCQKSHCDKLKCFCSQSNFSSFESFKSHMSAFHSSIRIFFCYDCLVVFQYQNQRVKHVCLHSEIEKQDDVTVTSNFSFPVPYFFHSSLVLTNMFLNDVQTQANSHEAKEEKIDEKVSDQKPKEAKIRGSQKRKLKTPSKIDDVEI